MRDRALETRRDQHTRQEAVSGAMATHPSELVQRDIDMKNPRAYGDVAQGARTDVLRLAGIHPHGRIVAGERGVIDTDPTVDTHRAWPRRWGRRCAVRVRAVIGHGACRRHRLESNGAACTRRRGDDRSRGNAGRRAEPRHSRGIASIHLALRPGPGCEEPDDNPEEQHRETQ